MRVCVYVCMCVRGAGLLPKVVVLRGGGWNSMGIRTRLGLEKGWWIMNRGWLIL